MSSQNLAYLEAHTKEKLLIITGPEFDDLEGHILVMDKALYGQGQQEHVGMTAFSMS